MSGGPIDAQLRKAAAFGRVGRAADSLSTLDAILAVAPAHREALALRAGMLMRDHRLAEADAAFLELIRHHPSDGRAWLNHGHLLKASGRIGAAIAAYRRAISVSPQPGTAWWSLADLKTSDLRGDDLAAMRSALTATADDGDRIPLHFAIARALDRRGEHADAFAHLRDGNALRLARAPHDADATSANFRALEALLTPAFLAARKDVGAGAGDPIFIVGLPRSGSTLVEQILASHPLIEGAGELHDLHRVAGTIPAAGGVGGHLAGLAQLSPARLRDLGDRYLASTRRHRRTDRPFFTDKMPSNWLYTGLIRLILPNARVVDVRRHPMACGFANFAQHYHWGNDFAYDLEGIGRFYADYVRHMAHVDAIAPGFVHRVELEALIHDPEGVIRGLLDWLGLPFDPVCLRFHETARVVLTPSADQVRRPINRDGADRWRAYERWLDPLARGLGPILTHHPAPLPRE